MKNFAVVMGLLFGSAGAHTCPKSGQVALLDFDQKNLINLALR